MFTLTLTADQLMAVWTVLAGALEDLDSIDDDKECAERAEALRPVVAAMDRHYQGPAKAPPAGSGTRLVEPAPLVAVEPLCYCASCVADNGGFPGQHKAPTAAATALQTAEGNPPIPAPADTTEELLRFLRWTHGVIVRNAGTGAIALPTESGEVAFVRVAIGKSGKSAGRVTYILEHPPKGGRADTQTRRFQTRDALVKAIFAAR